MTYNELSLPRVTEAELKEETAELELLFPSWSERSQRNAFRPPSAPMLAFADGKAKPKGGGGGGALNVIDPFRAAPPLALADNPALGTNPSLDRVLSSLAAHPVTKNLCIGVVDLQAPPRGSDGVYQGFNDDDMIYVGSLQKISPMYPAFELRSRVQQHVTSALAGGMSTSAADWKRMQLDLKRAWQPKLNKAFPPATFPQGFPHLDIIFSLSATGKVDFNTSGTSLADLDRVGPSPPTPNMKFLEWLKLMLRWSNNFAAAKCILALSYPYINGALQTAGLFEPASAGIAHPPRGLWISGNYVNIAKDWRPDRTADEANAGQPKSAPSRAPGTRNPWATPTRPKTNFGATARKVAQLFALMALDKLVDAASSQEMRGLLSGAELNRTPLISPNSLGSFIESALHGAGSSFDKVFGKIGIGDDGFFHDAGIVQRTGRGGTSLRYVAVVLGCAGGNFQRLLNAFVAIDTAL